MTYPEMPATDEEIRRLAERVLDRQTKNMVGDALILARWVLAHMPTQIGDDRPTEPELTGT